MTTREEVIALRKECDEFAEQDLQCKGEFHPDFHTVSDERFYAIAFESGRQAEREELMAPHEDTIRLEFMEAFGGECVCLLGSQFYYRSGFQQPHVKADTLREAIDGAIRARSTK